MANYKKPQNSKSSNGIFNKNRSGSSGSSDFSSQARGNAKPGSSNDLRKLAGQGQPGPHPISFGKPSPSSNSVGQNKGGSELADLLKKTSSSGLEKALGGGLLSFGLKSLFPEVADLFRGGNTNEQTTLTRFTLPDSKQQVLSSTSDGLPKTIQGSVSHSQVVASRVNSSQINAANQAEIVKAVKNALLTSSTLSDVIGEF